MDLDTMTNLVLNNEYKLHEKPLPPNQNQPSTQKKRGYGLDEYYEEERLSNEQLPLSEDNSSMKNAKSKKRKRTKRQKIFLAIKILIIFILLCIAFLFVFFKTNIFQKYKELWVQTAMTTMNHQYLATWFLSDEEIQEIMSHLEVQNNENSDSNDILVGKNNGDVTIEKITGTGYVGYVMTIPDASKVKLVDGRKSSRGSKLSEIVTSNNALAGINAGGFSDPGGVGNGNILCDAVIMNQKLLSGNKSTRYSLIGLSKDHKLVLGKYNYQEAINAGIQSAVEFGPFIIVNGNKQIKNANSGGIQPRMAIGQKKDGTMLFVCIDGRQPGYSIGTTLLELQNIFERYGAYNAANLDGGSSATMYYNGKVINKTSTPMGERYLPNAFIVEK